MEFTQADNISITAVVIHTYILGLNRIDDHAVMEKPLNYCPKVYRK